MITGVEQDGSITRLLAQWQQGEAAALEELVPYIYDELHQLASSYLRRERPGHTLQPTALVNEVYLRLAGSRAPDVESRKQFYGIAARLMRQVLVDHARKHLAAKRGDGAPMLSLDEALTFSTDSAAEFTALDQALDRLALMDPRKAQVVELRFFTGLTVEETAEVVGAATASVYRDLRFAVAFLSEQLSLP
jgi:RNA polymerase sigma-70 factor (ECF subfamily)